LKNLLFLGLLFLPYTSALSGPKFNPMTGKIDCNSDPSCFDLPSNNPKSALDIFLNASSKPIVSKALTVKDVNHSHLGTIQDLASVDMRNNKLDSQQLANIKSEIKTFLSGLEFPSNIASMGDRFRADTSRDLDKMDQAGLIAAMVSFGEISKTLGQEDLHSGASFYLSQLSPEVSGYLQKVESFSTPRTPLIAIKINAEGVAAAFEKAQGKAGLSSHAAGISIYSSGAKEGQWSEMDRAYGAFYGALRRGWQAGGAGGAVGGAVGTIIAPGPGTGAGIVVGAVFAASAGSIVGSIQGYDNPGQFDVKPTGTVTDNNVVSETATESTTDPETGIVTTKVTTTKITTETTTNLATGKKENKTSVEKNIVVTEKCDGRKCAEDSEGKDKAGDAGCEDPYDIDYRSGPMTAEEKAEESNRFKEQVDLIKGSLILLTEPRSSPEGESSRFKEWVQNKMDSTINPGFNIDKVENEARAKPLVRFDPLFDPQRELMRARTGK
jgi:hypothetical protein